MSPQPMYFDQKLAKTAGIIFLDVTLPKHYSGQLSQDSEQVIANYDVEIQRKFPKT